MICGSHGRSSKEMDLQLRGVHQASAECRSGGAQEAEQSPVGSRRETRATCLGVACREGWVWWHRTPLAGNGRQPYHHLVGPARVGRQGSDSGKPSSPTWWRAKAVGKKRPKLTERLHKVMEDATAGDPTSSVKWTRKSTRAVGRALQVSHTKAWRMLRAHRYRLRFNRKRLTRRSPPHRDEQFRQIVRLKKLFARQGQPIISVDAKKRELVGVFKNSGRTWRRTPRDVNIYDFPSEADAVAIPYGIYDVTRGDGFVVVGTSHNTPAFAANAVCTWWRLAGRSAHPGAQELLILADSGGSNGARAFAWKSGLQQFANKTGLRIRVAHYPPGASKWNPVEHRLFGPISINWAGQPLVDLSTVCQLIRHTRTTSGRRCRVFLDRKAWPTQKERGSSNARTARAAQPVAIRHGRVLPRLNYTALRGTVWARHRVGECGLA